MAVLQYPNKYDEIFIINKIDSTDISEIPLDKMKK